MNRGLVNIRLIDPEYLHFPSRRRPSEAEIFRLCSRWSAHRTFPRAGRCSIGMTDNPEIALRVAPSVRELGKKKMLRDRVWGKENDSEHR
jgi:hypothetical protein